MEDPAYEFKMQLINESKPFMKFRVVDDLEEKVMSDFISWIRYVTFEGDAALLVLAKNDAINEHKKRKKANNGGESDDSDEDDFSDVFKGTNLRAFSLENERKVWMKVKQLAED
jgi:hypothetical protein